MSTPPLPRKTVAQIKALVDLYSERRTEFAKLAKRVENDLMEHNELKRLIHSTKQREKDPDHLRDKLERKAREAAKTGKPFPIIPQNLFRQIGDLAGVRLLHIHTNQLSEIHPIIVKVLRFHKYTFREKPLVYIWDLERRQFLRDLNLNVKSRPELYTSVHYVVEPHYEKVACEIQVRTLAEELWGEVSHTINYPHKTSSIACTEQLAALARLASGCTRLVDSLFASKAEFDTKVRSGEIGNT
jgi:putative GTP pyrophosphokinase